MIIQVRGTSGSGKTTVMRRVMDATGSWQPVYRAGRAKPEYYRNGRGVYILGHYESPCGGCDSIGSARAVYDLIGKIGSAARVVLCEGLLLSEDVKWSSQLSNLRVLYLTTPLDRCLQQVASRRSAAGNDKPLNPANTTNRVAVIERSRVKLEALGVYCRRCSSEQAASIILDWIGESHAR